MNGGAGIARARCVLPADFEPPTRFAVDEFVLQPLGPEHNERDYAAWTSSMEHIRRSPGYGVEHRWPREMTLEENRLDLERHARDFRRRTGFTFTVLAADADVVGCVYVYPADDGLHDARVLSWLRASEAASDPGFRRAIAAWLMSDAWPFQRPLYAPLLS